MKHKRSVWVTLFKRALTQSTTIEDKELEEQRIEKEMGHNGYPRLGIAKMKKQANNKEEKKDKNGDIPERPYHMLLAPNKGRNYHGTLLI